MKYNEAFLSTFITSYNAGVRYDLKIEPGLVTRVKAIQREGGKKQWWAYCDEKGGGVHDPAKHEDDFLTSFITAFNSGTLPQPENEDSSGSASLAELIKEGQKGSNDFKVAWRLYCANYGNAKFDP